MNMDYVEYSDCEKRRVSWRSVIAGVVTVCAVSTLFGVLGVALGFTVIEPTSGDPLSGLGLAFGFWSALTLVVSFAAGGFMAGFFSGARGCEHAFLTWAVVLLIGTLFTGLAVGTAARLAGSAAQSVGSGAVTLVSGVGSGVAELAATAAGKLEENINLDFDGRELRGSVLEVLRDTDVPALQPEHLRDELRGARSDLRRALNRIVLDADNYDQIITGFLDSQKQRLDTLSAEVDREAAVRALMNNRGVSREEAEQAVDSALRAYGRVIANTRAAITDAQQQLDDARIYLQNAAEQARVKAEQASEAIAASALVAAIALILGAVICCAFGVLGNRRSAARRGRVV